MNLLAASTNLIDIAVEGIASVELPWLGYVIKWIFDLFSGMTGAIALGAIVFTLILKTLVLPLDIYSRVKMKKQSLLMENMRPQMEKLQKQYANDKNMYQQKVMELQKANGYNPLGACLPTLVSLVIFMVVFSAFSQYSQYANLTSYNEMVGAYSQTVQQYVLSGDKEEQNSNEYFLIAGVERGAGQAVIEQVTFDEKGKAFDAEGNKVTIAGYFVDYAKFEEFYVEQGNTLPDDWSGLEENDKNEIVKNYVRLHAREVAAEHYRKTSNQTSFPAADWWVSNVWYPDSMFSREVPSFSEFRSAIVRAAGNIDPNYEDWYNEVTYNLSTEKNNFNGYFVLIVLAIGLMFLQQFIMMRSQKAANELSSVDGQGATQNKMMMVIMPIIFGIFSFFYSAAFSIYMITNTVYSLISTLIINKVVSVRFAKNLEQQARNKKAGRAARKRLK